MISIHHKLNELYFLSFQNYTGLDTKMHQQNIDLAYIVKLEDHYPSNIEFAPIGGKGKLPGFPVLFWSIFREYPGC